MLINKLKLAERFNDVEIVFTVGNYFFGAIRKQVFDDDQSLVFGFRGIRSRELP